MDGKVRVAVRCRPLIPLEINEGCQTCVDFRPEMNQVLMSDSRCFTFDFVFPPTVSQTEVYEACAKSFIQSAFEGFHSTIFAYGQTGSGKTHTMGTSDVYNSTNSVGIIPQLVNDIYGKIESIIDTYECSVTCSFLEIYNEDLHDLLGEEGRNLQIREHPDEGVQIVGLSEVPTSSRSGVLQCLTRGAEQRTVASTAMNEQSSRSHAILTLHLRLQNRNEEADSCCAKFHLVDLAGSERVKKTHAEGDRFKEGVNINRGLLALGNVISALCERESNSAKRSHIPYRDSRLTRILQDSLGGNSQTVMIACISPADKNFEETLNTLRYADRARQIKNKPTVNRDPQQMEILRLKEMVRQLQNHLTAEGLTLPVPAMLGAAPPPPPPQQPSVDREAFLRLQKDNRLLTDELDQAIDRATALYRQVLQLELLQEQLQPRIEGLRNALSSLIEEYRRENRPPDVEDLEEHLKSIADLHRSLQEVDQVPSADLAEEVPDNGLEPTNLTQDTTSCDADVGTDAEVGCSADVGCSTEADAEAAKARGERVARQRELCVLDGALKQKEKLLASMQASDAHFAKKLQRYEEQVAELTEKIARIEAEREQLLKQASAEPSGGTSTNEAGGASVTRTRLKELETKLSEMRGQVLELKRVRREREQRESECVRLRDEIGKLKAAKVRMVRQMAEEAASNRRWKAAKELEVRKLQEKDRKMQNELAKMGAAHERRAAVFKRRMEAAAAVERRLKETLLRQRDVTKDRIRRVEGNDKSAINVRVKNWVSSELEKSTNIREAKTQLSSLLEDRKAIAEQLAHARRAGRQAAVEELELDLRRRNEQICSLQSSLSDADSDEQGDKSRWNNLHSILEARCGLKFMFKELVESRAALREKASEMEDFSSQLQHQQDETRESQARMEAQLQAHEEKTLQLSKEVARQAAQNEALQEELRRLQKNKPPVSFADTSTSPITPLLQQSRTRKAPVSLKLPQRKRRKVSEYEEPEEEELSEEEEDHSWLADDPNDSDWHATPFLPKKKRSKGSKQLDKSFEKPPQEDEVTEETGVTSLSPSRVSTEEEPPRRTSRGRGCKCRGPCKKRCGCVKANGQCGVGCSCPQACSNRGEVSPEALSKASKENEEQEEGLRGSRKRFGGSLTANLENSGEDFRDRTLPVTNFKRKLLDPRQTIFESPLLH